jgi:hypothetical protein
MWPFTKRLTDPEIAEHNQFVDECNSFIDEIHRDIRSFAAVIFTPTSGGAILYDECRKANNAAASGLDMASDIEEIREIFQAQIKEAYQAMVKLHASFEKNIEYFSTLNLKQEWPKNTKKLFDQWERHLSLSATQMIIESLEEPDALRIKIEEGDHRHLLNMFVSGIHLSQINELLATSRFTAI